MNITVLPPDINDSFHDFAVAEKDGEKVIRFGFSAIKNVGDAAIENIIEVRKTGKFEDIYDFLDRVDSRKVNRKVIESLIKSGCFDSLHKNRATLLASLDRLMEWEAKKAKRAQTKKLSLFGGKTEEEARPKLLEAAQLKEEEILQYEKELLGFFVSSNPMAKYESLAKAIINATSEDLSGKFDQELILAGIPIGIRKTRTKKKETMAFVKFMDIKGTFEATIFPKLYEAKKDILESNKLLVVIGNLDPTTEKSSVIVKDIIAQEELSEYIKGIEIFLKEEQLISLNKLKTLFDRNSGEKQVFVKYMETSSKTLYTIQTAYRVALSSILLDALRKNNVFVRFMIKGEQ